MRGRNGILASAVLFLVASSSAADNLNKPSPFDQPAPTSQSDCTQVQMWDSGGSMAGVPVTDQDGVQDCFAHAAAAAITSYVRRHPEKYPGFAGKSESPEAIYGQIMKLKGDALGDAMDATHGRTCAALKAASQLGFCDRDLVHRELASYSGPLPEADDPFFDTRSLSRSEQYEARYNVWAERIAEIYDRYSLGLGYNERKDGPDGDKVRRQLATEMCVALATEVKMPANLRLGFGDILGALNAAPVASVEDMLIGLMSARACTRPPALKPFRPPLPTGCETFGVRHDELANRLRLERPSAFQRRLHELLGRGKKGAPVGIEYCSAILKHSDSEPSASYITDRVFGRDCALASEATPGGDVTGMPNPCETMDYLNDRNLMDKNLDPACGFHASVVVGRKWMNGRCYFAIQNSWGTECNSYGPNNDTAHCDGGRVWVPEDELARNTLRITEFPQ